MSSPKIAFYGDDFTGSTDAMEVLARAGLETVLFTEVPSQEVIDDEFPEADVVGIAGTSRSMSPDEMDDHLPPVYNTLDNLGASLIHYKVCSTFDSAPEVGNIGHAIDLFRSEIGTPFVPVVVGAPELGRYVVFGNHFATMEGTTYRLDRHPVMSNHPVTPMEESDLRRHLSRQTDEEIGLVDVKSLNRDYDEFAKTVKTEAEGGIVFFDTLSESHMSRIGKFLGVESSKLPNSDTLFTVGSSGVEYALTSHWSQTGSIAGTSSFDDAGSVNQTIVMSGSASPVTDDQIGWALDNGFVGVRLDTARLIDPDTSQESRRATTEEVLDVVSDGKSAVVYTARGPDDPAIAETKSVAEDLRIDNPGKKIGELQAQILRAVLLESDIERACVAGGDTCGYVTPALEIYALETLYPLAPGSPLCSSSANAKSFDGFEIAMKGGQLGQIDYFGRVRRGH